MSSELERVQQTPTDLQIQWKVITPTLSWSASLYSHRKKLHCAGPQTTSLNIKVPLKGSTKTSVHCSKQALYQRNVRLHPAWLRVMWPDRLRCFMTRGSVNRLHVWHSDLNSLKMINHLSLSMCSFSSFHSNQWNSRSGHSLTLLLGYSASSYMQLRT